MTNVIKLPIGEVLKSAVVGIQTQPYADMTKFGLSFDTQEIKVLLIGGNSIKYDIALDKVEEEMNRLRHLLDWDNNQPRDAY